MKRRTLYPNEVLEAQIVFVNTLVYERVWVHENAAWPLWIAHLGAKLSRSSPPSQNAITLGNWIFLSDELSTDSDDINDKFLSDMSWLVHELTHVYQFEVVGSIYIWQALRAQRTNGYSYGGWRALIEDRKKGQRFRDYNREQQGQMAQDYYNLVIKMERPIDDPIRQAYEPFINDLRNGDL